MTFIRSAAPSTPRINGPYKNRSNVGSISARYFTSRGKCASPTVSTYRVGRYTAWKIIISGFEKAVAVYSVRAESSPPQPQVRTRRTA